MTNVHLSGLNTPLYICTTCVFYFAYMQIYLSDGVILIYNIWNMKLFSHRNTSELARVYLEICDILMVWKLSLLGKENTLRWGIIQCTMTWLREHAHTHTHRVDQCNLYKRKNYQWHRQHHVSCITNIVLINIPVFLNQMMGRIKKSWLKFTKTVNKIFPYRKTRAKHDDGDWQLLCA